MTADTGADELRTGVRGQKPASGRGSGRVALLFILPSLVGFLVFYVMPLIRGIYQSLTEYNILQAPTFIGLGNYRQLYHDPMFWNSLKVTAEYVAINISTQMIGALGIAVLMERLTRSVFVTVCAGFPVAGA